MSIRDSLGIRSSTIDFSTSVEQSSSTQKSEKTSSSSGSGLGGLQDRQVRVGDGEQRVEGRSTGNKIKNGFLRLGQGLLAVVTLPLTITAGVALGVMALGKAIGEKVTGMTAEQRNQAREAKAEQRFIQANQAMVDGLKTPQGKSLAQNEAVIDRLFQHAQMTGKSMTRQEIVDMVATGENIAKGLQDPANAGKTSPISVKIGDQTHEVASNTYTARAVSWFMMASAASQDVTRHEIGDTSTSDMTTSGSYIMKDPGNKMYNFLNAAPTAGNRMSTHFEERLDHSKEHYLLGFIPTFGSKPQQRGIEDFQSRMPGQGGTMLFDKLKPGQDGTPELFVKFESAGCPPYFSSESHHSVGDKFMRFFASLDRNLHHCVNFAASTHQGGGGGSDTTVSRQEHVKKGVLKDTVFEPVKDLAKQAQKAGLIGKDESSGVSKSMGKFGISAAMTMVTEIEKRALESGDDMMVAKARSLKESIQGEMNRLGLTSDQHGIARRGAEVHISIEPSKIAH